MIPKKITPKKSNEEKKTRAVTTFGLQLYKDARLTFATARGISNSINMMPFIMVSSSM